MSLTVENSIYAVIGGSYLIGNGVMNYCRRPLTFDKYQIAFGAVLLASGIGSLIHLYNQSKSDAFIRSLTHPCESVTLDQIKGACEEALFTRRNDGSLTERFPALSKEHIQEIFPFTNSLRNLQVGECIVRLTKAGHDLLSQFSQSKKSEITFTAFIIKPESGICRINGFTMPTKI